MKHKNNLIVIDKFANKAYLNKAKTRIDNLVHFQLITNNKPHSSFKYTLITSVRIDDDIVFQDCSHISPEKCIDLAIGNISLSTSSFKKIARDNVFDRNFIIRQATIKKTYLSHGVYPHFSHPFSKRIRKLVNKSDNVLLSFRKIMNSVM